MEGMGPHGGRADPILGASVFSGRTGAGVSGQGAIRGDVKIQQPRPSVCRSQSPPAATEWLKHSYMELFNYN